jgi:DNA polymerase-3 subunit delta
MLRPPPSVYLLHGDDDLAISEFVARLREKLGDPSTADLNMQTFNGEATDLGSLAEAASTAPFLARRRLIVVQRAGACVSGSPAHQERFYEMLLHLPSTTALVLVDAGGAKGLAALLRWAGTHADQTFVREFATPLGEAFAHWLRERCKLLGGEIQPEAARLLAEAVADDPRLAAQELAKLLDYVDRKRPIEPADVESLTPFKGQSDVFAMVDGLGEGDGRQALSRLHRLLEDEPARYAFAMIVRQFRLLLMARETLDLGLDPVKALPMHPFVAQKAATQAGRFTMSDLVQIYHRLLEADIASKTSQVEDQVALDSLVASLAQRP